MADKIKPCPFCGSEKIRTWGDDIKGPQTTCECGASVDYLKWNNRPSEKKLKDAIDVLMKAMCISMDEGFTHKMRSRRLNQALEDARKILKIDKVKKPINN